MQSLSQITQTIEKLVITASSGAFTVDALQKADGSLPKVGFTSLMLMNLVALLESTFGLCISPDQDPEPLLSVNGLVDLVKNATG